MTETVHQPANTRPEAIQAEPAAGSATAPIPILAIAGLALAAMCSGIALRMTDALLPRLAQEFSVSLGQASQVITIYSISYGLSQLVFGPMGDRFGKYRVVAWACMASALTSLLCAMATGHSTLLAARLLAGISAAAVIPLSMAWIGDTIPFEQRQPILARFLIGQISGFAIGVWIGGFAADHLDWRTPFFAMALAFFVVAVALQGVRSRLPANADRTSAAMSGDMVGRVAREFRAVFDKPWARVVLLSVCLEGAFVFGPIAFIAAHLHLRFGLPLSSVGAIVMLFAVGGIIFALFARALVSRLGERVLVAAGSVLVLCSMLALAVGPIWWWAIPSCVVLGLGFYMMHNTLQTHATQMA
ncbi:MAG: MFS transporter, partial [Ideonella sp.]